MLVLLGWLAMTGTMVLALIGGSVESDVPGSVVAFGLFYWVGQTVVSAFSIMMLLAISELIELAMDIESNTYHTAYRQR